MDTLQRLCVVAIARNPRRINFSLLPDELYGEIYTALRDPYLNERYALVRRFNISSDSTGSYQHMVELIYIDDPHSPLLDTWICYASSIGPPHADYHRTSFFHTINSISRGVSLCPSSHVYWLNHHRDLNLNAGHYVEERKLKPSLLEQGLRYDLLGPLLRLPVKYLQSRN